MKARIWLTFAALATLAACASMRSHESNAQTLQRYVDFAGDPVDSFSYLGQFDDWRFLGNNKLVIYPRMNQAYLLTVRSPCSQLPFARTIALTSSVGMVHRGFDYVHPGGNEQCLIEEIRPVDYKELKAAEHAERNNS